MRKSQNIRTYAFLLHDLPIKFSPILPFLTWFRKKGAWLLCNWIYAETSHAVHLIIAEANRNFKWFFETVLRLSVFLLRFPSPALPDMRGSLHKVNDIPPILDTQYWGYTSQCCFISVYLLRGRLRWDAAWQSRLDHVCLLRPSHQPIVFAP